MQELIYIPVERYDSRWTGYVSGQDGMFHNCIKEANRNIELNIIAPHNDLLSIRSGVVLDTLARTSWSFWQIQKLLGLIDEGYITSDSVLYFEDFWTPGFEMIPYACHLKGICPKVYAFCHAQSVDPHDFTFEMRQWMRHFERGWAKWLTGIFVAAKELKQMIVDANICDENKVHVTGTVMHRQTLIDQFYKGNDERVNRFPLVLFTSRLNQEKRPDLFLEIAKAYKRIDPDTNFAVLSGRDIPANFVEKANEADVNCFTVNKEVYFNFLSRAAVMLNTADQDFVSYGLLDALAYGCLPLLPDYLTFPDAVDHNADFLYIKNDVTNAIYKLKALLERSKNETTYCQGDGTPDIYQAHGIKYEHSVNRMLDIMFREKPLFAWIGELHG